VVTQINSNIANAGFTASSVAGAVTITAPIGLGTAMNSCLMVIAGSGVTSTMDPVGGGVLVTGVAPAYALTFDPPVVNADLLTYDLVKPTAQVWKGKNGFGPATAAATAVYTGIVTGTTYTAGWGRLICSSGDDGLSATTMATTAYRRCDFSVGTSGTDFVMSPAATFLVNTTSGSEIETTINTFTLKVKKAMG
jgi:hypothetical protein